MINFYGDLIPKETLNINYELGLSGETDINIFNLECSITNIETQEKKGTLVLKPNIVQIPPFNNLIFNLANNHIHDAGVQGILDTIQFCKTNHIRYLGAGCNILEARSPVVIQDCAVVSFCEKNETYLKDICYATKKTAGVNPLTEGNINSTIEPLNYKKVIVIVHWSVEHIQTIPLHLKDHLNSITQYKNVVAVIGHHPHVPQKEFVYNNIPVYPSLGNFYFPDFLIEPPIKANFNIGDKNNLATTYQYHKVKVPTLKKWKNVNKLSLVVTFNGSTFDSKIITVDKNLLIKSGTLPLRIKYIWMVLHEIKKFSWLYNKIHKLEKKCFYFQWRLKNFLNRHYYYFKSKVNKS